MNEKKPLQEKKRFNWFTVLVLGGVIVMLGLWDAGWKPRNAFLTGILLMFSPMFALTIYKFYDRRESLKQQYYMAQSMFAAQRILKEQNKRKREREKMKNGSK